MKWKKTYNTFSSHLHVSDLQLKFHIDISTFEFCPYWPAVSRLDWIPPLRLLRIELPARTATTLHSRWKRFHFFDGKPKSLKSFRSCICTRVQIYRYETASRTYCTFLQILNSKDRWIYICYSPFRFQNDRFNFCFSVRWW